MSKIYPILCYFCLLVIYDKLLLLIFIILLLIIPSGFYWCQLFGYIHNPRPTPPPYFFTLNKTSGVKTHYHIKNSLYLFHKDMEIYNTKLYLYITDYISVLKQRSWNCFFSLRNLKLFLLFLFFSVLLYLL